MTDPMPTREQLTTRRLFADTETFAGRKAAAEAAEQTKALDSDDRIFARRLFGDPADRAHLNDNNPAAALFGHQPTDTEETP